MPISLDLVLRIAAICENSVRFAVAISNAFCYNARSKAFFIWNAIVAKDVMSDNAVLFKIESVR